MPCTNFLTNDSMAPHNNFGSRSLPEVADWLAISTPDRLYASVACSNDIGAGFRDVTMRDLAKATNFMAMWIDQSFGRSERFETVGFMGTSDIRYGVLFLALVK